MAELTLSADETRTPSSLDGESLFEQLKRWFDEDQRHWRDWRDCAIEDYDFAALEQWSEEDKRVLAEERRVPIVFDGIGPLLRTVAGQEISNRQEARYIPMEIGDVRVNEELSEVAKWFRTRANAEKEDTEAFYDTLVCGMGWTELCLDYEGNPDGDFREDRIDPLEMLSDYRSQKANLTDARRLFRVKDVPLSEAIELFPNEGGAERTKGELDAAWARDETTDAAKQDANVGDRYNSGPWTDDDKIDLRDGLVTIVECQWYEKQAFYRVIDPTTGESAEFDEEKYTTLLERSVALGFPIKGVKQTRKVYRRAFLGSKILQVSDTPDPSNFSYQCITGFRDRNRGTWFGLVKPMKDPQRWKNKWLSQILHILNSQASAGLIMEEGAIKDWKEFEANYTKPNSVVKVSNGTLSNPQGQRFQPKPQAQLPVGYFQLWEMAANATRESTGINLEMLGMREATQPGVLEYQRRQSGVQVLAGLFDNLRLHSLINARILLYYIQNYLSDERLVRIGGEEAGQLIPLIRERTLGEYDVIVDDAPTAPNQKEAVWQMVQAMLPVIGGQLTPQLWAILLEYSPFPSSVVAALKEAMQPPEPTEEEQALKEIQMEGAAQTVRGLEAEAAKDEAQAMNYRAQAMKNQREALQPQLFRPPPQAPRPQVRPNRPQNGAFFMQR